MNISIQSLRDYIRTHRRGCAMYSLYSKDLGIPPQFFALSTPFVDMLESKYGKEVSFESFSAEARNNSLHAVTPEFSHTAINSLNSLFFSSCTDAFAKHTSIANFFVSRPQIQYSFLRKMMEHISSPTIRVHEICCGSVLSRWQFVDRHIPRGKRIELTLSDISDTIVSPESISRLNLKNMTAKFDAYDLREDFPTLPKDRRYDVLLTTYGFDSVWLPEDAVYEKIGKKWYQILFRIVVSDDYVHRDELLSMLRAGSHDSPVPLKMFHEIGIECVAEEIDISSVPYGSVIDSTYKDYDFMPVNFPGGFISRVDQIFERQLHDGGMILVGDVMNYVNADGKLDPNLTYYNTTGKIGKYKVDDYFITEKILRDKGYIVEIYDAKKFSEGFGKTFEEDSTDTFVLCVRK